MKEGHRSQITRNTQACGLALSVASLGCVSLVTWFDEDTPLQRILECRPEILVKGSLHEVIRARETYDIVLARDRMPDWLKESLLDERRDPG